MITELSITILFICNEPVYAVAEIGGKTRAYEIEDGDSRSGQLHYSLKNPDLFYNKVMRQMMIRNKPHRFIRKECYES